MKIKFATGFTLEYPIPQEMNPEEALAFSDVIKRAVGSLHKATGINNATIDSASVVKKRKNESVSQESIEQIKQLKKTGMSLSQIAQKLGIEKSKIYYCNKKGYM